MHQLSFSSHTHQELLFLAARFYQNQVKRGLTADLGEVDIDQSRFVPSGGERIVALYRHDGQVVAMYQIDGDDFCEVEV